MITKISIINYRIFRTFTFLCNPDLNTIVGNNETGKSTILEAIHLALTRRLNGRLIDLELSPYLFNNECVEAYVTAAGRGDNPDLPKISIEVHLSDQPEFQPLRGTNNGDHSNSVGVKLEIAFDEDYREEYRKLLDSRHITVVPTEYYKVSWHSFAGAAVTARSLPLCVTYIDATTIRLQSGTDYYLNNIIKNGLDAKERVGLSVAYRRLKELFAKEPAIEAINRKLTEHRGIISDKDLAVAIDISQKAGWETSLTPHLDDVPFQLIGKGEQNAIKLMLALDRKADDSHVVLIEEPENHLSYSSMSILIDRIHNKCKGKQVFATTHSAYVLNKLGIGKTVLLNAGQIAFLNSLSQDTQDYFKKLSGYDTLRLILAKRSILVEGPSDELLVQKAYLMQHGKLPLQDGVDVINVRGLSFTRFLDIAKNLGVRTAVVTDNDGDYQANVVAKYEPYSLCPTITIHADARDNLKTLEPQIVDCNSLEVLNGLLSTQHASNESLLNYMTKYKTEWALRLFEATQPFTVPEYVRQAVK